MATKSLPAKPDRDAAVEPARGKGPAKGQRAPAGVPIRGKMVLKPPVKAAAGDDAPKSSVRGRDGDRVPPELPDQKPARRARSADQYVRLRVRVDGYALSIVGGHLVDGPLAQTSMFEGSQAYEVTDGDRMLHAGSLPDLGFIRSFAHPEGTLEQRRHHMYELSAYEFDARVPAEALKRGAMPNIAIVLYRVKDRAPASAMAMQALTTAPLGEQRARELREIGRVVGLPASVLPSALAKKANRTTTVHPTAEGRATRPPSKKR